MDEEGVAADEEERGGGFDPELIKSYLNFFKRAIRSHRLLLSLTMVVGIALTLGAYKFLPRTYTCQTVLMVDSTGVLERADGSNMLLLAAESLIMRHDNLETIIREKDLIRKYRERRPPLLALKDKLVAAVVGPYSQETMTAVLVGTMESKVSIVVANGTLTVTVNWTDGKTAAEIAEAARESYVKTRHNAEMAAFEEKLTILDAHATSLRDEIETLAKQARSLVEERSANEREALRAARKGTETEAPAAAATPPAGAQAPRQRTARTSELDDVEGPRKKAELESKRKQLAEFERSHDADVTAERRKLEDLKLKLTPNHPEVVTQQKRLAAIEQEPSQISLLRSEIQTLEEEVEHRSALNKSRGTGSRGAVAGATGTAAGAAALEPLPGEISQLLDAGNIDPALSAQLSSAVSKYGMLRDDIRSGRIQFDTAQAAFNYRYRVVVPADPPKTPTKPKAVVVILAGLLLSLLVSLAIPIALELRSGIIVERWQVATMQLPVLADLRLPPSAGRESEPPTSTPG